MTDRYTINDAKRCAKNLADKLGKQLGDCWEENPEGGLKSKIGCWNLDYNTIYGGAVINEIVNEGGAIRQPFGYMRRGPREFCNSVDFASNTVDEWKKGKLEVDEWDLSMLSMWAEEGVKKFRGLDYEQFKEINMKYKLWK